MVLKEFAFNYGMRRSYKKHNSIHIHTDQSLFYIKSGIVKLLFVNQRNQLAVDIYKEGEFFGYVDGVCTADKGQLQAVFMEDTELLCLDRETVLLHADMNKDIRIYLIRTIGKLLHDVTERIIKLSILKKRESIYSVLYYLTTKFGKVLNDGKIILKVKLNDTDIKELCNTSREYVNRTLSILKNDGILEKANGYYIFSSKEDLNRLVC
ncbi:Crp/Fnr family transcriptional regulator [Bacillus tuaregi]|uniref:Crp/Fnr family transcriptional regulator n=1 Tax=Bacillus tuaregi TaxID=1816695 RepID=UPI0008F9200C|nr:Crp/Fnr family transcriptional regulator [Bacillus tuaregi]